MDISEMVPVVGLLLVLAACVAGIWGAGAVHARGRRLGLRTVLGVLGGGAALIAVGLVYFDLHYVRRLPQIPAPDGRHVALVTYTVGTGVGFDEAEVAVRSPWSPLAHRVYAGPAHFDPETRPFEPQVEWIDAGHLAIRFHTYEGTAAAAEPQGCAASADGVVILCEQTRVHAVR